MKSARELVAASVAPIFLAACTVVTTGPASGQEDALLRTSPLGAMVEARAAHQASLVPGGDVLVTGGCGGRGCDAVHASTELWSASDRTFRPAPAMATPRASHAAVGLRDGRVLVAGGWTGDDATAGAELYDPGNGHWTPVAAMGVARVSPAAVPLVDGRVLLAGGLTAGVAPLASAEVFDPATAAFTAVGSMQTPRGSHAAVALADGRVLVTGGHRARGELLRSAEIFDPETGTFAATGDMAVPRHKHAAVLMADGRVLVVAGSDARDHDGRYRSTEVYDPASGTFSPGPQLRWARHKIGDAVVRLADGAVLVAGGAGEVEVLRPGTDAFTPLDGELDGERMFATATLLPDGRVLVLGGYDERIRPSSSAHVVGTGR